MCKVSAFSEPGGGVVLTLILGTSYYAAPREPHHRTGGYTMHDRNVSLPAFIAAICWFAGFAILAYDLTEPSDEIGRAGLALCTLAATITGWAIACSATKRLTRDVFELGRDTGRLEAERSQGGGLSRVR